MKAKTSRSLMRMAMAGLASAGMLVSMQAFATPMLPVNTSVELKFNNFDYPVITTTGQEESGIFDITSINNAAHSTTEYWASGISDGTYLVGYFTGLVSSQIIPTSTGDTIYFTGGTMNIYEVSDTATGVYTPTSPTNTLTGSGGLLDQICGSGGCPAPYLTLDFKTGIVPTDPSVTESASVNGTTAPISGSGFGELVVTGGSAASVFGLGSVASYNSNFNTCANLATTSPYYNLCKGAGSWPLASFDPVTVTTVPDPATVLLLGLAGLIGGAFSFRRRLAPSSPVAQ